MIYWDVPEGCPDVPSEIRKGTPVSFTDGAPLEQMYRK